MNIADLIRRIENLIRPGVIAQVQHTPLRVRVATGGLLTGWLMVFAPRAGEDREWDPPSVGEQCLVLCPSGNPEQGFALVGLYGEQFPAPDDSLTRHRRSYRDGAVIEYDTATHQLRAALPDGGTFELIATGGSRIVGPVRIEGTLHATEAVSTDSTLHATDAISTDAGITAVEDITTDADVLAGDISLTKHRTSGVLPGNGTSGVPVP
jgi:phage baseplate assembly protein V